MKTLSKLMLVPALLFFVVTVADARSNGSNGDHGGEYHHGKDKKSCSKHKGGHGKGKGGFMGHIGEALDLSPDQLEKASALKIDYKKKTIRLKADIKIAEIELKELLGAPKTNMDKVKAKVRAIETLKSNLRIYRLEMKEDFKKILTGKQLKKFNELKPFSGYGRH